MDLEGRLVTPALIDCHTHVVHGGNRAREFEMRLEGASYEEMARAGGGIVSTVSATRAGQRGRAAGRALPRVDALIAEGVATVEIKSGYGLDIETELKMLRVARRSPLSVRCGCAPASWAPMPCRRSMPGRADAYIDEVCLPALRPPTRRGWSMRWTGSARASPSPGADRRVFDKARELGLPVKLHAEQLSNLGGAASWRRATARCRRITSNTPRTRTPPRWPGRHGGRALPGAFYTLRETQAPPIERLPQARRADGGGDRLQPRLLADDLAAACHEHGLHAVPPDAGGGAGRRHPQRGARAGA
jgi:imidazolonepropionase